MKRIISLLLSVVIFSAMVFVASAYAEDSSQPVSEISFEADILSQLGFISGSYSQNTTRSELAGIMVSMMNMSGSDYRSSSNPFLDVDASNPAYPSLKIAYNLGILSGGYARPNDYVSFSEAVKMAVCMSGYGVYADYKGGYPGGYIAIASENGFLKGVKPNADGSIDTSALYVLLYNALHVDIMDVTSIGEEINYQKIKGETVLSRYHGIYFATGMVYGTKAMNMLPAYELDNDEILIDFVTFKDGTQNAYDMVGCEVDYYYDNYEKIVLALGAPNVKITSIQAQSISEFKDLQLWYEENDKEVKVSFNLGTRVMYNNAVIESFDEDLFYDKYGTVKLIDNGSDGKCDAVIINTFEACVVSGIDISSGTVYDYYTHENNLVLDPDDSDYVVVFKDEYGNNMTIGELAPGDVISYSRSQDKKTILAYYSNTEEIGTIESVMTMGDGSQIVVLNDKEYRLTEEFSENEAVVPGMSGAFRITTDGRIASKTIETTGDYGYLITGKQTAGLSSDYLLKIFAIDSEMLTAKLGDKVKLDGDTLEAQKAYEGLKKGDSIEAQLVRYECDNDGKIIYIDTAKHGKNESPDTLTRNFSSYYDSEGNPRAELKLTWRDVGMFSATVPVSTSAKVFLIPKGDNITDDDYIVTGTNYFRHDNNYAFECFKSVDKYVDSEIAVCSVEPGGLGVPSDLAISLVSDVTQIIDEDNMARTCITIMSEGVAKSYVVRDEESAFVPSLADETKGHVLKSGDIIKASINTNDEITAMELYYDIENDAFRYPEWQNTDKLLDTFRISMGEIYYQAGGVIQMHIGPIPEGTGDLDYEDLEAFRSNRYTIYTYDSSLRENKVRVGSVTDIADYKTTGKGTKAIVYSRSGQRGIMILYI